MTPEQAWTRVRQIAFELQKADYGMGMPRDYQRVLELREQLEQARKDAAAAEVAIVTDYDPERVDMRVEKRQGKLAANTEATERWQRRLFRAANELQKLAKERKRLLNPSKGKLVYKGEHPTGMGGGAVEGLNDDIPL